jgi:uncharacterized protein YprB with RNaseH-like and TPR domain
MALIFDIETIGVDFDNLDEITKHNLTRWIKREAAGDEGKYNVMLTDLKEGLGFSPLTGEIVTIGVLDTKNNKGVVYYQAPNTDLGHTNVESSGKNKSANAFVEDDFTYKQKTEEEMLKEFWQGARHYREFVSFNGRSFDIPFLILRSAVHRIKSTVNLMSDRYLRNEYASIKHIDLLDQLSFYGAVRRKGNLHLYCQALGIKSPKTEGITGDDIGHLFKKRRYKDIARYNSWDLIATRELYKTWQEYIRA